MVGLPNENEIGSVQKVPTAESSRTVCMDTELERNESVDIGECQNKYPNSAVIVG